MSSPGRRFVDAIVAKDRALMTAALAPDVDFKALTPGRLWEGGSPADVLDAVLGHWFADDDLVESVVRVEEDTVADTHRISYRFEVSSGGDPFLVEQQAYYRADGDDICYLRVICSGYRPRT